MKIVHILRVQLFLVALMPTFSFANERLTSGLSECSAIADDTQRLACYDLLVKLSKPKTASNSVAGWEVQIEKDPLTDATKIFAFLKPIKGYEDETLIVRCDAIKEVDIYISWRDYLGSDDILVTTRVDKNDPVETLWNISSSNTATFAPNPRLLFENLLSGETFVAKTTPYSDSSKVLIFSTIGLVDALGEYVDLCRKR